jgi:hypothetical protein
MAAKFTKGDSESTTRSTYQKNPPKNVRTRSESLKGGSTMAGMPGYINAHQSESMDHARGGKGVGPHREGSVGKRGSSGAKGMGKGADGTTTKSYRAASTRSEGTLKGASSTGSHHVHTKERRVSMPGQKAPPTTSGNITGRRVGIDMAEHRAKNREAIITGGNEGHRGRMERLSGTAKTRSEGRRRSVMY